MQIINGDIFIGYVKTYRSLWLNGRYGGGKTSFATVVAARLFAEHQADFVASNIPIKFATPAEEIVPFKNTVIVLDEAWQYLESWKDVKSYAAWLRKRNLFLIAPSVFPIHQQLSALTCQRIFNAYVMGLPFWLYRWDLSARKVSRKGYFAIWKPSHIFGWYDTNIEPEGDGGIVNALQRAKREDAAESRSDRGEASDGAETGGRQETGQDGKQAKRRRPNKSPAVSRWHDVGLSDDIHGIQQPSGSPDTTSRNSRNGRKRTGSQPNSSSGPTLSDEQYQSLRAIADAYANASDSAKSTIVHLLASRVGFLEEQALLAIAPNRDYNPRKDPVIVDARSRFGNGRNWDSYRDESILSWPDERSA